MKGIVIALATAGLLPAATAHAGLTGTTISETYNFPSQDTPYGLVTYAPQTFLIGTGLESTIVLEDFVSFKIDFLDAALLIDIDTMLANPVFSPTSFNGIVFSGNGFGQFSGVTFGPGNNIAGLGIDRVLLTNNSLRLNFQGLSYNTNSVVALNFTPSQVGPQPGVPEPDTWAMMLLGFGGMGYAMRQSTMVGARIRFA